MRRNSRSEEGRTRAHFFAPATRASRLANRASKARLNAPAASALSITIKSLFWRLRPDAEKFAATVQSNRPSISRLRASAYGAHGDRMGFLRACFSQNLPFGKRGCIYAGRQQGTATAACDCRFSHSGFLSVSLFSSASARSLSAGEAAFDCSALFGSAVLLGSMPRIPLAICRK